MSKTGVDDLCTRSSIMLRLYSNSYNAYTKLSFLPRREQCLVHLSVYHQRQTGSIDMIAHIVGDI